jgi:hypothetical protein
VLAWKEAERLVGLVPNQIEHSKGYLKKIQGLESDFQTGNAALWKGNLIVPWVGFGLVCDS